MPKKFNQLGIIHLWLILVTIGAILGIVFLGGRFNFWIKPSPSTSQQIPVSTATEVSSTPASTPAPQQVQKGDLVALEKYCKEEASKLPEGSFTFKSKTGPTLSGPMPWIDKYIPKDKKQAEKKGCTMAYLFDGRPAYSSVGTTYPGGIIEFKKIVYERFATKLDSSWERIKSDEQIFKRENPEMGTVDFVDIFDGGLVIYIKFNTYYK